jgi:hypothetical protein
MIMKSQLGFRAGRAHTTEGIEARHLSCFVSQIVKTKFATICDKLGYESTVAFKELSFLCIQRNPENEYDYFYNASEKQLELLNAVGFDQKDMKDVAEEESRRANKRVFNQVKKLNLRKMFDDEEEEKDSDSETSSKPDVKESSVDTKKETKSQQTVKQDASSPPHKRGRRPGVKNRPKEVIEAEKAAKAARGRGRPKGSPNKPKKATS